MISNKNAFSIWLGLTGIAFVSHCNASGPASSSGSGILKSREKLAASVSRFNLGEHLKRPTSRELREGVVVSERFEKNPHIIRHHDRDLLAANPDPDWATGDTPVIKEYTLSAFQPGKIPLKTNQTQDAMPFGDGPGVMPAFPQGTTDFWTGEGNAQKMWEVVACPVTDVGTFLTNPMRCVFGEDSNPYGFLADTLKDTNAISDIATGFIVDAIMDIVLGVFPLDLFSDIFNALCPLIELISDVVDLVGTPTDINGDGCFTDDLGFFGTMLSVTPVGLIGCAVEDARRLEKAESTEENLSMKVCDDQPQKTGENFQFGQCGDNSDFQCWKPLFAADPQARGVCLPSRIVEGVVAGDIQPSVPLLLNIYQVIQQSHTADQVEIAKTAILDAIGGDDGLKEKLNAIDSNVQDIKTTVNKIDGNTKKEESRRRLGLGTDRSLSDESIEELLRSHAEDLNEKSEENGVPGQVAEELIFKLLKSTKGPEMKEARDFIKDQLLATMKDPQVTQEIGKMIKASLLTGDSNDFLKDASVQLIKMATNKRTGKIDVKKLKEIKEELEDFVNGGTDAAAAGKASVPRFLSHTDDGSFCTGDGVEDFKHLLESFIRPQIEAFIETVATGLEVVDSMFDATNFYGDDGAFAALLGLLLGLFQDAAKLFLFGDTSMSLPSEGRILPIRATKPDSEGSFDVYMASGCDSEFEGELQFYSHISGVLDDTLEALSNAVGQWFNTPIELVKWLLKQLFALYKHMDGVCSYLDSYVQLALVEATFENSRFTLQEVACRPVDTLSRGHGCDGIDNDCNFQRDECDEDVFPPEINAAGATLRCADNIFPTSQDALDCFSAPGLVSAVDDCREVDLTFEDKDASTCSAIIGIKATALGQCGSRIDEDITEIDVTVAIDSKKPEVTCELGTQDLYGKGYGDFTDLDFSFTAIDECTDTDDLAVTIEVLSNEKVAIGDEMVVFSDSEPARSDASAGAGNTLSIWAEDSTCYNSKSSAYSYGSCKISSPEKEKTRIYLVRVTAIDKAGNVGVGECSTIVGKDKYVQQTRLRGIKNYPFFLASKLEIVGGMEPAADTDIEVADVEPADETDIEVADAEPAPRSGGGETIFN